MADDIHYKGELEDYLYEFDRPRRRTESRLRIDEIKPQREIQTKEVRVASRQTIPRLEQEEELEPLKRRSPEIFGTLFDRIEFIRKRIDEINDTIGVRENMHKTLIAEINADIKEKEAMEVKMIDMDEKRNIRLDISLLRKEKRQEAVRFWKDVVELKADLRDLLEKYETETNIAAIFKGIAGD